MEKISFISIISVTFYPLNQNVFKEQVHKVPPIPRVAQGRLQECLKERAELLHVLEAAERSLENERERADKAKEAWEKKQRKLEQEISKLQQELRHTREQVEEMKKKQEVQDSKVQESQQN